MTNHRKRPAIGGIIYFGFTFVLGLYFAFAAIQGDYGLFRRIQIDAEADTLRDELAGLGKQVQRMENKTRRLSDDYLDLDLLDEQARSVLGMIRADEVVIR